MPGVGTVRGRVALVVLHEIQEVTGSADVGTLAVPKSGGVCDPVVDRTMTSVGPCVKESGLNYRYYSRNGWQQT